MFEEEDILLTLTNKVNNLLQKYDELVRENENMHNEIVTLKAQNEAKTNQIFRLEERLSQKNSTADELLRRIEGVLGKPEEQNDERAIESILGNELD